MNCIWKNIQKLLVLLVSACLFATSCMQNDIEEDIYLGEQVSVSFSLNVDDNALTRVGEGTNVDKLLVAIYDSNDNFIKADTEDITISSGNIEGDLSFDLLKGQTYKAVFFAYQDGAYTFDSDSKSINFDYDDISDPESLNAFHKSIEFTATSQTTISETLKRPLALMVFGTKDDNFKNYRTGATATVEITNVSNSFNAITGEAGAAETLSLTFTPDGSDFPDNSDYTLLGMVYVLAGEHTSTLTIKEANGNEQNPIDLGTTTHAANNRYNYLGNKLIGWDGTISIAAIPAENQDANGWIHIRTAEELAYLLKNGDNATVATAVTSQATTRAGEVKKYHICADIDMSAWQNSHKPTTQVSFTNSVIDGGKWDNDAPQLGSKATESYSITGITLTTNGMLGNGSALTVQNLNIVNSNIDATIDGVGMLIGTATDSVVINNVNINGGTVSGKNKVGGIIGYITNADTITPTVTISNSTSSAIISATPAEDTTKYAGALVGCLRGYDANDKLSFQDCTHTSNTEFATSFCTAEQACFNTECTVTDDLLGGEEYCRGTVKYNGEQFFYQWDGVRTIEPINAGEICTPFELAYYGGKSVTTLTFTNDVDMGGAPEEMGFEGAAIRDNEKTLTHRFTPIKSVKNLNGNNWTIHNLRIQMLHDKIGAGLIQTISGGTAENLTIRNAYVHNKHNIEQYPIPAFGKEDEASGNAEAAVFAVRAEASASASTTVHNIKIQNSNVYGVCKMGGLIGRATTSDGIINVDSCSVDSCSIENYNPKVPNYYAFVQVIESFKLTANCLEWWFTCGEIGGLIGFIKSNIANISNCSVTNTDLNCIGQPEKDVALNVYGEATTDREKTVTDYKGNPYFGVNRDAYNDVYPHQFDNGKNLYAKAYTRVAGRHINQFIGDVVSERQKAEDDTYIVTVSNHTVSGNTYNGTPAENTTEYNHDSTGVNCPIVGALYYVGIVIEILNVPVHIKDYPGRFVYNNGTTIEEIEETSDYDNNRWIGGNFHKPESIDGDGEIWIESGKLILTIKGPKSVFTTDCYPHSKYPTEGEVEAEMAAEIAKLTAMGF